MYVLAHQTVCGSCSLLAPSGPSLAGLPSSSSCPTSLTTLARSTSPMRSVARPRGTGKRQAAHRRPRSDTLTDPPYSFPFQDKAYALERATRLGKKKPGKLDFGLVKRALSNWKYPCFVMGYCLYGTGCQASGYFGIYLKAQGYSVSDRNVIPSGAGLISAGEPARHPTSPPLCLIRCLSQPASSCGDS